MSDIIKLLPDSVANQIAAGEVVQRPASAVKELLENSIDAGASELKLIVKDSGKTLIQVIDNGKGMSNTDARMSFERHATSKISSADDLFNLNTKGFRGEALSSIAAISQVELKTRREIDDLATIIKIEGSKIKSQDVCSAPVGTSISIKNLFFNIPARRNFLKSEKAETKHIVDEFLRIALAHPDINFTFTHNKTTLYNLRASSLKKRIDSLFGSKTNDKFFPIEEDTEIVSLIGFVGKPEFAKRRRGEQFFFVNDRFIKSSYLNHAVSTAFEGLLPPDSFPSYFIYLDIDPKSIDINIHPTKTEIKFDDERSIYAILRSTIKHSLGQYNISPSLDFSIDRNLDEELMKPSSNFAQPTIEVDPDYNPFQNDATNSGKSYSGQASYKKPDTKGWDSLYSGLENLSPDDSFIVSPTNDIESSNITWEEETEQAKLGSESSFEHKSDIHFQLHKKYILSHVRSGMLTIDQNRAHERILYDYFYNNITQDNFASQQLLFPIEVEMNESQWALLQQVLPDLEKIGYSFVGFQNNTVTVSGIPIEFSESDSKNMIDKILGDIEIAEIDIFENKLHLLALSFAKTKAVKYGSTLQQSQMSEIVNKLFACANPNYSPSGKLITNIIDLKDLDEKFN
ncbi:MAG: DNA mismatch repair endonuclease MutL [Flavobacteriales bacterium]|nr:DNA mismatch repair endonuclease MutL [Flavobacteriales bacterium]